MKQKNINFKIMKVLDFYADWCNPCKALAPVLDKVLKEKKLNLTKINVEEDTDDLSAKYNVRNIPTVIVVDDNDVEVKRFSGTKTETDLNKFFDELL